MQIILRGVLGDEAGRTFPNAPCSRSLTTTYWLRKALPSASLRRFTRPVCLKSPGILQGRASPAKDSGGANRALGKTNEAMRFEVLQSNRLLQRRSPAPLPWRVCSGPSTLVGTRGNVLLVSGIQSMLLMWFLLELDDVLKRACCSLLRDQKGWAPKKDPHAPVLHLFIERPSIPPRSLPSKSKYCLECRNLINRCVQHRQLSTEQTSYSRE